MKSYLSLQVNGRQRDDAVSGNLLLVDYLREVVGLTGTKIGCDGGECGLCTVLIDGKAQHSCLTLAATCNGKAVETIESLGDGGRLSAIQRGFHEKLGAQCGFCTPGFVMATRAFLNKNPNATLEEIQKGLGGNLCRCGTYHGITQCALEIAGKGGA